MWFLIQFVSEKNFVFACHVSWMQQIKMSWRLSYGIGQKSNGSSPTVYRLWYITTEITWNTVWGAFKETSLRPPQALKTLGSVGCLWCLPALSPALTHGWELARCTTVHACLSTLTADSSQVKFHSPFQDLRGSQPALMCAILKDGSYEKEVANGGVAWSLFHISETFVSSASSRYLSLYLSSLVSYTKLVADFCRL